MRATGILMAFAAVLLVVPSVTSADPAQPQEQAQVAMQPAPTDQDAAPSAVAGPAVNLDEVVCRSVAPPTGSRLGGGRECHSVREWNQREQDSREALLRAQQTGFATKGH